MKIGDETKIFLKGESPWGTILEIAGDKIKVRIDSKLFFDMSEHEQAQFLNKEFDEVGKLENPHGKTQGDEVWCERGEYGEWVEVSNLG